MVRLQGIDFIVWLTRHLLTLQNSVLIGNKIPLVVWVPESFRFVQCVLKCVIINRFDTNLAEVCDFHGHNHPNL